MKRTLVILFIATCLISCNRQVKMLYKIDEQRQKDMTLWNNQYKKGLITSDQFIDLIKDNEQIYKLKNKNL